MWKTELGAETQDPITRLPVLFPVTGSKWKEFKVFTPLNRFKKKKTIKQVLNPHIWKTIY